MNLRSTLYLMFIAAFAANGVARADDPPEMDICSDVKDIPAIKKVRQAAKLAYDAYSNLNQTGQDFRAACNAYKENPSQDNSETSTLTDFQNASTAQKAALDNYHTQVTAVTAANNETYLPIKAMKHEPCGTQLGRLQQTFTAGEGEKGLAKTASACDLGLGKDARAADAANSIGKDPNGKAPTADTLLNPRANATQSAALLQQAKDYAAANGLPDPTGGDKRDKICGESCVAILRAQAIGNSDIGTDSTEYMNAMNAARATKRGIYGTVYSAQ